MVVWCSFREWFLAVWILRLPFPLLSMPVVGTSTSTGIQKRDMLTMPDAVLNVREAASCSWMWALCYTTAVQRLQRQGLCQQTQCFKAMATIVGSSRKERSCLGVPKVKTGSRRMLLRNNEQKLHIYVEQKLESSRNSPSCFCTQSIFSLAHMGWASASFLPQTVLLLAVLRQKQDSQCSRSHSY